MNRKWIVLLMLAFFGFSTQIGFAALSEVSCKTITSPTTLYFKPGGYTTFMAGQSVTFRPVNASQGGGFVASGTLLNNTTLYYGPGQYRTYQAGTRVSFSPDGWVQ